VRDKRSQVGELNQGLSVARIQRFKIDGLVCSDHENLLIVGPHYGMQERIAGFASNQILLQIKKVGLR
jgi:hypothetical protein